MNDLEYNLQNLSDKELDKFYADSFGTSRQYAASEIISRLSSLRSFIGGIFGEERFPLFASISKFSQSNEAQTSIKNQAGKVTAEISKASAGIAGPFIILGVIVLAIFVVIKWRK